MNIFIIIIVTPARDCSDYSVCVWIDWRHALAIVINIPAPLKHKADIFSGLANPSNCNCILRLDKVAVCEICRNRFFDELFRITNPFSICTSACLRLPVSRLRARASPIWSPQHPTAHKPNTKQVHLPQQIDGENSKFYVRFAMSMISKALATLELPITTTHRATLPICSLRKTCVEAFVRIQVGQHQQGADPVGAISCVYIDIYINIYIYIFIYISIYIYIYL